jgi:hypothetical protein
MVFRPRRPADDLHVAQPNLPPRRESSAWGFVGLVGRCVGLPISADDGLLLCEALISAMMGSIVPDVVSLCVMSRVCVVLGLVGNGSKQEIMTHHTTGFYCFGVCVHRSSLCSSRLK